MFPIPSSYAAAAAPRPPMPPHPPASPMPPTAPAGGGYAPYAGLDRPLMTQQTVPVPKNDQQAVALIHTSKAALDHHATQMVGAHPAVQMAGQKARAAHTKAVVGALSSFHSKSPTKTSGQIMDAINNDPTMKPFLPSN